MIGDKSRESRVESPELRDQRVRNSGSELSTLDSGLSTLDSGFTYLDLTISILIVAIAAAVSRPHIGSFLQSARLDQAARRVVLDLRLAQSQAIRLPKPVALPESVKKVDIVRLGHARLIAPAGEAWDSWFDGPGVSDDFMASRDQPEEQVREEL